MQEQGEQRCWQKRNQDGARKTERTRFFKTGFLRGTGYIAYEEEMRRPQ